MPLSSTMGPTRTEVGMRLRKLCACGDAQLPVHRKALFLRFLCFLWPICVWAYNPGAAGRRTSVTDALNHATTFYYDDRGNVTTKIDALGGITSYSYYPDTDRVKFEVDHYGNVKSMAYDARGNVIVQTIGASASEDPANPTTGHTTRTTYNAFSAPTQITDPDGRVQTFGYDPATNNLLTHTVGVGGLQPSTSTYTYNADGTLDTITNALGNVTLHSYNYSFSNAAYSSAVKQTTVVVTDPSATTVLRTTRTVYDAQENMLAQIATRTLPGGGTEDVVTKYLYDSETASPPPSCRTARSARPATPASARPTAPSSGSQWPITRPAIPPAHGSPATLTTIVGTKPAPRTRMARAKAPASTSKTAASGRKTSSAGRLTSNTTRSVAFASRSTRTPPRRPPIIPILKRSMI